MALTTIWFHLQALTSTTWTRSTWTWALLLPTWWAANTSSKTSEEHQLKTCPNHHPCRCSYSSSNCLTQAMLSPPPWKRASSSTTTLSNTIVWCRCLLTPTTKTKCRGMANRTKLGTTISELILSHTLTSNWWKPSQLQQEATAPTSSIWVPLLLQWWRTQWCTKKWAPTRCSRCNNSNTVTTFHLPTRLDTTTERRCLLPKGKYLSDTKAIIKQDPVERGQRAFLKQPRKFKWHKFWFETTELSHSNYRPIDRVEKAFLIPWGSKNVNRV